MVVLTLQFPPKRWYLCTILLRRRYRQQVEILVSYAQKTEASGSSETLLCVDQTARESLSDGCSHSNEHGDVAKLWRYIWQV
jgi:hypothetical protein